MTNNVKRASCSPISTTNERVEQKNKQQSPATIHAIHDGSLLDANTIRIKLTHEDCFIPIGGNKAVKLQQGC